MNNLSYIEIRKKYIEFLKARGHVEIAPAPLVPENDPSVLFVNAGMFPLVPFLLGEKHPAGTRLTNVQRSLRTGDIDEVGDTSHLTAFDMLGNWSLNDYFKEEAINITIDFVTQVLGYEIKDLWASTFIGDDSAAKDTESQRVWKDIFAKAGIDAKVGKDERIQEFDKKSNWWELEAGGPCGPDSEFFFDTGKPKCGPDCNVSCNCGKYIELGNNVFMEYLKKDGKYSPLGKHNVDFGGGLDRWTMFSQGKDNIFETDIYLPILKKVQELSKEDIVKSQRIIVDHIKAATWVIMDGVVPGRTQQSYILRRLIRRAIRHGKTLGIEGLFTRKVAEVAIDQFSPIYPQLEEKKAEILQVLEEEEIKFNNTLADGLKEMEKSVQNAIESINKSTITLREALDNINKPAQGLKAVLDEMNKPAQSINAALEEWNKPAQSLNAALEELNKPAQSLKAALEKINKPAQNLKQILDKTYQSTEAFKVALKDLYGPAQTIETFRKSFEIPNKRLQEVFESFYKPLQTVQEGFKKFSETIYSPLHGDSFRLFETYGFPPEMFLEELKSKGLKVDEKKFMENHNKAMLKHQELSRTASKGQFKGGLADTSEMSAKYHTAQHLLLAAMRKLIGEHIVQKGSNITTERLRFDFPSAEKLTDEQIKSVEKLVNDKIADALQVSHVEMPKDEALKLVPFAAFSEKYSDVVKVYSIGDPKDAFSVEICNGPHVENTSVLGRFKIVKQENLGAGLKRIKAILE